MSPGGPIGLITEHARVGAERFDGSEGGLRSFDFGERHGAIEHHHRRPGQRQQVIVELDHDRPVRSSRQASSRMGRLDRRLELVAAGRARAAGLAEQALGDGDL